MTTKTITKTWTKRGLSLVLTLALICYLFVGMTAHAATIYTPTGTMTALYTSGNAASSGAIYSISSETELEYLADYTNSGGVTKGVTFYLTDDIELNASFDADDVSSSTAGVDGYSGSVSLTEWTPIGGGANGYSFQGVFDGCGYTVYNIFYNESAGNYSSGNSEKNNIGLFGKLEEGAIIQNISIDGGYVGAQRSVGGIVGKSWGTIYNCHNLGTAVYSSESKGVGGIVGANWVNSTSNPPEVNYCSNEGDVICAYSSGSAGGIAGENEGQVYNCWNTGSVTSPYNAGGMVGSNKNDLNKQSGSGGTIYGGINNCYNTGTITGRYAGGIAGYQTGSMRNCYNIGNIEAYDSSVTSYPGQLIGELNSSYDNTPLYYLSDLGIDPVGKSTNGEVTASSFGFGTFDKSALLTNLNTWVTNNQTDDNTYATWTRTSNKNDGYPTLVID